jgi:hypothetical protein
MNIRLDEKLLQDLSRNIHPLIRFRALDSIQFYQFQDISLLRADDVRQRRDVKMWITCPHRNCRTDT